MCTKVLCIMDGLGIRDTEYGNAVKMAKKPNLDYLIKNYPHSKLEASGELVGLPAGQMGNSEVGHTNIGAGRIVYQPLQLITNQIKNGEFFQNKNLLETIKHVKDNHSNLHICGLLSDGGIHSHINHLFGLIDLCKKEGISNVYYHVFLDGRDTLPNICLKYLDELSEKIKETSVGSIASISGRYYAMDRDNRWDRVKKAYDVMVTGTGIECNSYKDVIEKNYNEGIFDEFIVPTIIDKNGMIKDNDGLIAFNFRPDRLREIFKAITNPDFSDFEHKNLKNIKLTTMMPVSDEVICNNAFELQKLDNTLGEYLSKNHKTQLRIAETEKYAHVTYFFDGGVEKDLDGCKRILVNSPKVATYDLKPEMSAYEVTDKLIKELDNHLDVVILNFANGDMVGHTGNLDAAIKAVETVDDCIGKIYKKVEEIGGTLIVTADHGNSEVMIDDNGNVITSHTTNKVPFIITDKSIKLEDGKLADIAPTMLYLLGLDIPKEMTGNVLIKK